jgi:hypothetical protein
VAEVKVFFLPNPKDDPEYDQGYHYALEVRFSTGDVLNRWTFRTASHAQQEMKRLEEQLRMPSVDGSPVIPC